MKKYLPHIFVFLVFIVLLVLAINKKSSVIENTLVMDEITRIEQLSVVEEEGQESNITPQDLNKLKELVKEDKIAESYAKELEWLVEHNESQHILHSTSFMRDYIETGKDSPCVPHELWHVSLFAKHGDMDYARQQAKYVEKGYKAWEESIDKKREAYAQFYKSLDELKAMIKEAIAKLKQNDYSEKTLEQLELIGSVGLC